MRAAYIENTCTIDATTDFNVKCEGKGINLGKNSRIGVRPKDYLVGRWCKCIISQRQPEAVIRVGERTILNGVNICAQKEIIIGDDCQIACGVSIMDYNAHKTYSNPRGTNPDTPDPIHIGKNVWIGINAIILKGTSIGDNSIVGAGTVVKGDFPSYSLILGNPAYLAKTLDKEKFHYE